MLLIVLTVDQISVEHKTGHMPLKCVTEKLRVQKYIDNLLLYFRNQLLYILLFC